MFKAFSFSNTKFILRKISKFYKHKYLINNAFVNEILILVTLMILSLRSLKTNNNSLTNQYNKNKRYEKFLLIKSSYVET